MNIALAHRFGRHMATSMHCAASILLMVLSLEALLLLVAGGTSAAAVISGGATIRLPSDSEAARGVARPDKRPWECCDFGICTLSIPPICRCMDKLDRCSNACKECEEIEDSRYVCADTYRGDPGPTCHDEYGKRGGGTLHKRLDGAVKAAAAALVANDRKKAGRGGGDDDEKRPWKCCDMPLCVKMWPPVCRCADTVERCASTCENCEQVEEGSGGGPRYRCLDLHSGDPGPTCSEEGGGDHDWARRLAIARGHRF